MNEQRIYRRVLRRETHSSRSVAAIVTAAAIILGLVAIAVVAIRQLVDPVFRAALSGAGNLWADVDAPLVRIAGGVVLVLVGLLLVVLAASPGRRARHARIAERSAVIVDDGVIADAIATAVGRRIGVDRRQVAVIVGRRAVQVRVTPTSGVAVDASAVRRATDDTMAGLGFASASRIEIATDGVIA